MLTVMSILIAVFITVYRIMENVGVQGLVHAYVSVASKQVQLRADCTNNRSRTKAH